MRPARQPRLPTTPDGGPETTARRPTTRRMRWRTVELMSAAEIRHHLCALQLERLETESSGLVYNRAYMADLESEQTASMRSWPPRSRTPSGCGPPSPGANTAESPTRCRRAGCNALAQAASFLGAAGADDE